MIAPAPPSLRLIRGERAEPDGWTSFTGESGPGPEAEHALARAYGPYGTGLLQTTPMNALPGHDDAFLVIDSLLRVRVISRYAARLLGEQEEDVLDKPVANFLGPADTEAREPEDFLHLLRRASTDSDEGSSVFVRPRNAFGVRLVARIAPCGPPRAALVLLKTRALRVDVRRGRYH
jgi:hypothetical protein